MNNNKVSTAWDIAYYDCKKLCLDFLIFQINLSRPFGLNDIKRLAFATSMLDTKWLTSGNVSSGNLQIGMHVTDKCALT